MRVALISRSTTNSVIGGDTIQMMMTAKELRNLGIEADVFLSSDAIPYEKYDLLHLFNIIRPGDYARHITTSKKPYVISTIFVDYSSYDQNGRSSIHSFLFRSLGNSGSEYLKNLYRYFKRQDKLVSPEYLLGHKRAIEKILNGASLILPNSLSEYKRISKSYGYTGKYAVVPNGVNETIFSRTPDHIQRKEKVICVGQIYGLKNQLSLIKVCSKLDVPLDLIGNSPPNHQSYLKLCKKTAGKNVRFIDFLPQEELIEHYAGAKVHAMPSWFETTGLSSLEAGALGCNLLVGKGGDTRDYFTNDSWFCEANDLKSIEKALTIALKTPNSGEMQDIILTKFTWKNAAIATLKAYEEALAKQS